MTTLAHAVYEIHAERIEIRDVIAPVIDVILDGITTASQRDLPSYYYWDVLDLLNHQAGHLP